MAPNTAGVHQAFWVNTANTRTPVNLATAGTEETALCPCQPVYLYREVPPATALLDSQDNTAKLPRTPRVTQTTPVLTEVSAPCFLLTSTSASVPEDGQDPGVSMRTAVYLVLVPMVERAAPCLVAATHVPALLATQVLAVLMTQMNVLPHPPYARTKDHASTTLALTSVSVPRGLLANTVKAHTFLAHLHHALMEAPATRALKPATHATAFQVSMGLTVKTTSMTALVISVPTEEPVWMESTPTTVSALQSGQASTAQKM